MYKIEKFCLAREAITYIIKEFDIDKIYIPYYLCDVVRHTIFNAKCSPKFYHIDNNFMPVQKFTKDSFILYPNYFGICDKNVQILSKIYPKLIVDNAHSFFSKPSGLASFNAGHKFNFENSYLYIFDKNYDKKIPKFYSNFDEEILKKRKENFINLDNIYKTTNLLKFENYDFVSPFVYPYLAPTIEDADKIAKAEQKLGKTIYRYWNALPQSYNEYKFYSCLVPIPID